MKQSQVKWNELADRAKKMTSNELFYARQDCIRAAEAADDLERAGVAASKTGGYYLDESSVYAAESRRRAGVKS